MNSDMNPLEHIWDFIRHSVYARDLDVQNLTDLETVLHQECQQLPLDSMRIICKNSRREQSLIRAHSILTTDSDIVYK